MPENTNKFKLSLSIWGGSFISLALPEILGAAYMTTLAADENFANAFDNAGYGGIMGEALFPLGGFGKFLLVIMAISVVG
jgi:purine-cytosine permease-like protein